MSGISPTLEGFRAAFHRPSLTLAEIAWRWTFGSVALTLLTFSFIEYLDTLPVTEADASLLATRQPLLVGKAISHILRGSLDRVLLTALLTSLALGALWIVAASLGRAVTIRALLDYFRRDVASNESKDTSEAIQSPANQLPVFRTLLTIHFLRFALTVAGLLAFAGAAILVSFASPVTNPQPGLAFILFLPFAGLICLVWPALNWLLSLASIFVMRDGDDTWVALSAAAAFSRDHAGPVFAVSAWTGLAHLVVLSVAGTGISLLLAFIPLVPAGPLVGAALLGTLAYCAIVDWLYIARLAGYVCIAELPATAKQSVTPVAPSPVAPSPVGEIAFS
ncbi:MAG TPA: hypothetical protein VFE08_02060 [Candidatus Sulfotelmatobacter sp.]|jgi:hypothetical protein|nr:hypothetical protein [Candidatus Sulfotelmatobacter sp.]